MSNTNNNNNNNKKVEMKYQYPRSKEAVSVAPPKELTPPPAAVPVDTVQDLINRKQEAEKNRFK